MTSQLPPSGWDRVLRRLMPQWFLTAWGAEVTELLRAEESAARLRGRTALMRFRVTTLADLLRAAWQTHHRGGTGLGGDVRLALRLFRRSPGFTVVAISSMAIGVALATTAFSVLDSAFWRPLPFPQADRLVSLRVATFQGDAQRTRAPSYAQFRTWQAEVKTSADVVAAYQRTYQQQEAPGGVEEGFNDLPVLSASPDFLTLVGARVSRGRSLTLDDHRPGAPAVVVISEPCWQRLFSGRADVVGATVKIAGIPQTVVGVLAPDFHFDGRPPDVIRPFVPGTSEPAPNAFVRVVARLREGADAEHLARELGVVIARDIRPGTRAPIVLVEPLRTYLYGWAAGSFGPFAGAAAVLLLLVIANVANLTLARASRRRQEMALRTALGAARARLARLVAVEAGVLTIGAGALGLVLSWWTIDLLVRFNARGVAGVHPVFDLRAALFGAAVAVIAGAVASLWPGLSIVRREHPEALRQGPQQGTDTPRQRFSQRALVMCQIACALVVLTGAGLLTKTVLRMQSFDFGIDTNNLLNAEVEVPEAADGRGDMGVIRRLLDELSGVPGVTAAGLLSSGALTPGDSIGVQSRAGDMRSVAIAPTDRLLRISPGYLEAVGVPIVAGRMLTRDEWLSDSRLAIVTAEAARRWWPADSDVIGARIKLGPLDSPASWVTVVGVVRNTTPLSLEQIAADPAARVFVPMTEVQGSMLLAARSAGDPLALLPSFHARAVALDRRVRILLPVHAKANLEWGVVRHRETAMFVGGLAAFGLLLAAMGIYGVTTYAVGRRVREIGIRKALGAGTGHIAFTVSREFAMLAIGGIVIGLAASAALTRMIESMLYGTNPLDASVFAGASLVIVGIVAIATWMPMRTALRVDPIATLRCE